MTKDIIKIIDFKTTIKTTIELRNIEKSPVYKGRYDDAIDYYVYNADLYINGKIVRSLSERANNKKTAIYLFLSEAMRKDIDKRLITKDIKTFIDKL